MLNQGAKVAELGNFHCSDYYFIVVAPNVFARQIIRRDARDVVECNNELIAK